MRKALVLIFIACLPQPAWGDHQPVKRAKAPFKVEISIDADSLHADVYTQRGQFYIDTKITNISTTTQDIVVWTQQGWSWIADTSDVMPDIAAKKNISTHLTLQPHEAHHGRVVMFANPQKARPVTFRLGFFPQAERPISVQPEMATSEAIIWSNSVRLTQ